jgi:HEAT repeat protein
MGFIEVKLNMFQIATLLLSALLLQNSSLDSPSPKERMDAIEQMTGPGNRDSIPVLGEALKKESRSDVRVAINAGLGRIGDPQAAPILAESLRSDLNKDVRLQAVDSMQRLYIPVEESGSLRTVFNRVKSVFAEPDRPLVASGVAVDSLVKEALSTAMQKDFNEDVRAAAARALGSLVAKDQVPALIATLESPQNREHAAVRLQIVESLGVIRDPAAGPALEKVLRDNNKEIQQQALVGLGLVTYKEARPLVEEIFRTDRDKETKKRALESLSLMRDPATTSLFESLLSNTDDYYREMAAEGLARVEYKGDLKERHDQEKKPNVKNALAFGLASAGHDEYITELAQALDSRQDYQAEAYLYELGKFENKLPQFYGFLRDSNPRIRARMARVIGNIGDPSSRDQIQALTQDGNIEVLREATAAFRKLNAR